MTKSDAKYNRAICLSRGIYRIPHLAELASTRRLDCSWGLNLPFLLKRADLIIDWGRKRQGLTAQATSKNGTPVLSLEDGFIRSMGLGVENSPAFSLVRDWSGIYYDARQASDLENILNGVDARSHEIPGLLERARYCIDQILEWRISKYNSAPNIQLPARKRPRLLLIDQTCGDLSISTGLASADDFEQMLTQALQRTDADILIKTHPDVISGRKQGYLGRREYPDNVQLLAQPANPLHLLEQVDEVHVVTSQMGFEACMAGLPVRCYGLPFYAGWGLTEDVQPCDRRQQQRTLEEVFAAAYLLYSSYFDPETRTICDLETVLEHIIRQKHQQTLNEGHWLCLGFDRWKQGHVRKFLKSPGNQIEFRSDLDFNKVPEKSRILIWGRNIPTNTAEEISRRQQPISVMEDGFIRSLNLGKYGTPPLSLVLDQRGIYFDPRQPSDLEHILANHEFTTSELSHAEALRLKLVNNAISKYNLGQTAAIHTKVEAGQKMILVPGQVGIDASITCGCDQINTDLQLLQAVRDARPNDYLLYKPHPDVVSGNIKQDLNTAELLRWADQIETDVSIHSCLEIANEVHSMTSLVGFEALLRQIPVSVYGRPFYAGWGLTKDQSTLELERRSRKLTLNELVAGTLILYPRYLHPETGQFTTAIRALDYLTQQRDRLGTPALHSSLFHRWLLKVRYAGLTMFRDLF